MQDYHCLVTQLIEPETGNTVVQVREARTSGGPFSLSGPRRMNLSIVPAVVPMLDAIVLSLIILDQERREQSVFQHYSTMGTVGTVGTIGTVSAGIA